MPNKNKINILFIMMSMEMGGSESLVYNLVKNINTNQFNPHIGWFFGVKKIKLFTDLNVPLIHIPKLHRIDLRTFRKIDKIIREYNIDIINAHHFMSMFYAFYGCKIKNNIGLVYTEHSEWEIDDIPFYLKVLSKFILRIVDKNIGISNNVSNKILNSFSLPLGKVQSISNGIDLSKFHPRSIKSKDIKKLKEEFNINNDDFVVGNVANIKNVKNHIFLLKAFKKFIQNNTKSKLVIVGKSLDCENDNSIEILINYINKYNLRNNVIITGYREDVHNLLHIMDVFCLTSYKEGLPLSIIEAMASKLPIIGTDVDGIKDLVEEGKNGFLVNLSDVATLTDRLVMLRQNKSLRNRLGEYNGLICENFSVKKCIKAYENIFKQIVYSQTQTSRKGKSTVYRNDRLI